MWWFELDLNEGFKGSRGPHKNHGIFDKDSSEMLSQRVQGFEGASVLFGLLKELCTGNQIDDIC
jgi:hypothetical protein